MHAHTHTHTIFTINLVGHQDAGDVGSVLPHLLVPARQALVRHLPSDIKYLKPHGEGGGGKRGGAISRRMTSLSITPRMTANDSHSID